jgi:hypothetical protein
MNFILKTLLLTIFSFKLTDSQQYIYINVCSDNNCNSNCVSWIATNDKCTPCKDLQCSDDIKSSITTYDRYTVYSDLSCEIVTPNTHPSPLIINDNNCNQLYLYNDGKAKGSYKSLNFSILIGIIVCLFFILLLLIYFLVRYIRMKGCCSRRRRQSRFEIQNGLFIVDNFPQQYPNVMNTFHSEPPLPSAPVTNKII